MTIIVKVKVKANVKDTLCECDFSSRHSYMPIMYSRIFVVGHTRQKMLRNGELGEICGSQYQRSVLRQDLNIIRMLLIAVGVFFCC